MDRIRDILHYIDSVAYRMRGPAESRPFGHAPFVTISRPAGVDGKGLAEAVLKAIARRKAPEFEGWAMFDKYLFQMLAEHPRLRVSMKSILEEEYRTRTEDFFEQILRWQTPQDVVLARVLRALRALAGAGRVVIVGRSGACATADLPGGVHVRAVASEESRLEAIRRKLGLDEKGARAKMRELDDSRRRMAMDHFRRDIADPLLYDAVFNADRVGFDEIAEWVAGKVEAKSRSLGTAA